MRLSDVTQLAVLAKQVCVQAGAQRLGRSAEWQRAGCVQRGVASVCWRTVGADAGVCLFSTATPMTSWRYNPHLQLQVQPPLTFLLQCEVQHEELC